VCSLQLLQVASAAVVVVVAPALIGCIFFGHKSTKCSAPHFRAVHQSTILAPIQKERLRERESAKELAGKYAKLVEKSLTDSVV